LTAISPCGVTVSSFPSGLDYVLDTIEDRVRRQGGSKLDVLRACRRVGHRRVLQYFGIVEGRQWQAATT
jgi:hypothetical protein